MRARNKIFHLNCFRCVACDKQLVQGDEFALMPDGLVCKEHHANSENNYGQREENNNVNQDTQDDLDDEDENSQDGDKDLLLDDRLDRFADSGE